MASIVVKIFVDAGYMAIFAAAAWIGLLLSARVCEGIEPFSDGPAPGRLSEPFVLVAAALVGLGVALRAGGIADSLVSAVIVVALAACTSADIRLGILPDVFTLIPLGLVVGLGLVEHRTGPLISAVLIAVPFGIAAFATRGRGLGWGDVKLASLAGAIGGFIFANVLLAGACLVAAVVGRLRAPGRPFALGPYITAVIGIAVAAFTVF